MKYIKSINGIIIENLKKKNYIVFGQNIISGSRISGLSSNLETLNKKSLVTNVPNCENSLIGMGFGVMLNGGNAIYFAKQLDFMLLGVDHFVNTFNNIKLFPKNIGSFNIFLFVSDQGHQGPQSSFNNADNFSSLSDINTFQINTKNEAKIIIPKLLKQKGFNIICLSQRLISNQILEYKNTKHSKSLSVFSYFDDFKNYDTALICFNFSFEKALEIKKNNQNKKMIILNINFVTNIDYQYLFKKINKSKKIIILSDNKSNYSRIYKIIYLIKKKFNKKKITLVDRDKYELHNSKDKFEINYKKLKQV